MVVVVVCVGTVVLVIENLFSEGVVDTAVCVIKFVRVVGSGALVKKDNPFLAIDVTVLVTAARGVAIYTYPLLKNGLYK